MKKSNHQRDFSGFYRFDFDPHTGRATPEQFEDFWNRHPHKATVIDESITAGAVPVKPAGIDYYLGLLGFTKKSPSMI